jgi:hypothetical protein
MNDRCSPISGFSDYQKLQDNKESDSNAFFNGVNDWKTIEKFLEVHDQFQMNQLRWLLRDREDNGLDKAIRKIGKRIYIHDQLFADWMLKSD